MSLLGPILVVIVAWWLGTGLVLYLQQTIARVRTPLIVTLIGVSLVSLVCMVVSAAGSQPWQSYLGFVAAICLWGCIELSYYTGLIGGVHKRECPDNCAIGKRFRLALGASIWHEISVLFAGGVVMTLLLNAENPVALYCFLVLWLMRWSAKLNLFFGVPNFNTDWFPRRLSYAHSYIRRAPVTLFFPISVLSSSLIAFDLVSRSMASEYNQALMTILPGVLLSLAILEHLFMALPIADSELWNRIFARDDHDSDSESKIDTPPVINAVTDPLSAQCIQARTQERIHKVMTVSTNGPVSVTLGPVQVDATATHPASQ
ncbi:MAG: putative photosynthetic complex assembly protein PuhE [Granulosicoccus sp.]